MGLFKHIAEEHGNIFKMKTYKLKDVKIIRRKTKMRNKRNNVCKANAE